jgi:hypothetical protein
MLMQFGSPVTLTVKSKDPQTEPDKIIQGILVGAKKDMRWVLVPDFRNAVKVHKSFVTAVTPNK